MLSYAPANISHICENLKNEKKIKRIFTYNALMYIEYFAIYLELFSDPAEHTDEIFSTSRLSDPAEHTDGIFSTSSLNIPSADSSLSEEVTSGNDNEGEHMPGKDYKNMNDDANGYNDENKNDQHGFDNNAFFTPVSTLT